MLLNKGAVCSLHCFPARTSIAVAGIANCTKRSSYFKVGYKNINEIKIGDLVLSYDEMSGKKEFRKVLSITPDHVASEFVTLYFSNGNELRCTPEHPIAVDDNGRIKWIKAIDVEEGFVCIQYGQHFPHATKGKTYEESYGDEKAQELKQLRRENFSGRESCLKNKTYGEAYGEDVAAYQKQLRSERFKLDPRPPLEQRECPNCHKMFSPNITGNEYAKKFCSRKCGIQYNSFHNSNYGFSGKIHSDESKDKTRSTMIDHWNDQTSVYNTKEYWRNRAKKPNNLEMFLTQLLDEKFNGDWKYVGNFAFNVGDSNKRRFPDFVHNRFNKVIEVYHPWYKLKHYESIEEYRRITVEHYQKFGYEVIFIEAKELSNKVKICEVLERVRQFVYNPNTFMVKVIKKNIDHKVEKVYNLEVEKNNNYFARGILVHNCHPHKMESFFIESGKVKMEYDGTVRDMLPGESITILPGKFHRFSGYENSVISEASTFHSDDDVVREEDSYLSPLLIFFDIDGTLIASDGIISKEHIGNREFGIISSRSRKRSQDICDKMSIHPLVIICCRVVSRCSEMKYADRLFPIRRMVYIGDMISDGLEAMKAGWDFLSPQEYVQKVENGEV